MSYDKINFVDGQVLTADQLNHMESGIERAIPNPDTAAVGQTIRVSAVDGSGKPTAWEAVDFPSGGGGGGYSWDIVADVTLEEATNVVRLEFEECQKITAFMIKSEATKLDKIGLVDGQSFNIVSSDSVNLSDRIDMEWDGEFLHFVNTNVRTNLILQNSESTIQYKLWSKNCDYPNHYIAGKIRLLRFICSENFPIGTRFVVYRRA